MSEAIPAEPLRVLVVDDQDEVRGLLAEALASHGHPVDTADSGEAGLDLAQRSPPDVILLDIDMPGMNGLQVLQVLRQGPGTAAIPVILLTASRDLALMEQGFQLGCDDYLQKPFNVIELRARIRHHARQKRLNERIHALQELDRLKDDFVAVLSHELRTPLTAIIGFATLLLNEVGGPLTQQQQEFEELILRRAEDMQYLIEELVEFNLIRTGRRGVHRRVERLGAIVGTAADSVRLLQKHKALRFELRVPEPDLLVQVDGGILQRILVILLRNAIKFTPAGGQVTLDVTHSPARLLLRVSDTGIGIAPERQAEVFAAFRQLEPHMSRSYEGLGLGLAIARHLAELHGGRIWVESAEGKGSTFTVALPLAPDARHPLPLQGAAAGVSDKRAS